MTHTSHTPGPWRVTATGLISSNEGYVPLRTPFRESAFYEGDPSFQHRDTADANARLIAEAPAMLEVIKDLLDDMGMVPYPVEGDPPGTPVFDARAIIARIEGEA